MNSEPGISQDATFSLSITAHAQTRERRTQGAELTGIGGVSCGAVEEAGGPGDPEAGHGSPCIAIHAGCDGIIIALLRG